MRTILSRVLLAALVVAGVFAIGRLAGGGSHPTDVVHFERLDAEALRHAAFTVGAGGARVAVHAVGSFEGTGATPTDTALAATGWLVRRESEALAWHPRPRQRPTRGSVFSVRDTLALAPGTYDAYFASFGDPLVRSAEPASDALGDRLRAALSRGGRAWLGESDRWRFVVTGVTETDRTALRRLDGEIPVGEGAVWASGPVHSGQTAEAVLRVEAASRVRLRGVTEVTDGVVADSATVVSLDTGEPVWTVDPARGRWAGGSLKNQAFDTTLILAPGLYRVRFAADRSHAADDWTANPPYVPSAWGLRVDAEPGARVAVADLRTAEGLPEIARLDCVGPDRDERVAFTLAAPTTVLVVAAGEMSSSSSRYDYATLEREADTGTETVWTMDYDRSEHAGGADRNRRETATLSLEPGRYALRYRTDDSHDCTDDFPGGAPDEPLWGAVVVALSPGFDPASVSRERSPDAPSLRQLRERPAGPEGETLASLTGVGPNAERDATFSLDAPAEVQILAVGELFPSERLDWGWIENMRGETVWTMTRENTAPAGGASQNRIFSGVVSLPAGSYRARFRTNERHDAERFDGAPPRRPEAWGIHVSRVPAAEDDESRD